MRRTPAGSTALRSRCAQKGETTSLIVERKFTGMRVAPFAGLSSCCLTRRTACTRFEFQLPSSKFYSSLLLLLRQCQLKQAEWRWHVPT